MARSKRALVIVAGSHRLPFRRLVGPCPRCYCASVRPWVLIAVALAPFADGIQQARAADAATEAESLIQRGILLRKAGDDAAAVPLFEHAYSLHPTARAAAQVGFAEQAIGRFADAEKHVAEALQASNDPWIRKYRATIEQALSVIKEGVCTVEVVAEPPGATVRVNGRQEGVTPLASPLRVTQGTTHLEVSASGYESVERNLTLKGGGY